MTFPPNVLGDHATIDLILAQQLSFSRLGDGEYRVAGGKGTKTQPAHPELAKRLRQILRHPHERVLVGILPLYDSHEVADPWPSREDTTRRYGTPEWAAKYLNLNIPYGCASVSRMCNWALGDRDAWRQKVTQLWDGRDVLIVCGSQKGRAAEGMVRDHARSAVTLGLTQQTNAWARYGWILNYCRIWGEGRENALVLAALGATATVLAHDLGALGVQAIDIGHLPQSLAGVSPKELPEP